MKSKERITLLIDNREQRPWRFSDAVDVEHCTLHEGDYSAAGFESSIAIERKSVDDAVQSVTWSRERFFRELERLRKYDFACIIIEGSLDGIAEHQYTGMATPRSIMGSLQAIHVHFGIPVYFASNAELAAEYAEGLLVKWVKRAQQEEAPRQDAQDSWE